MVQLLLTLGKLDTVDDNLMEVMILILILHSELQR